MSTILITGGADKVKLRAVQHLSVPSDQDNAI